MNQCGLVIPIRKSPSDHDHNRSLEWPVEAQPDSSHDMSGDQRSTLRAEFVSYAIAISGFPSESTSTIVGVERMYFASPRFTSHATFALSPSTIASILSEVEVSV